MPDNNSGGMGGNNQGGSFGGGPNYNPNLNPMIVPIEERNRNRDRRTNISFLLNYSETSKNKKFFLSLDKFYQIYQKQ